MPPLQPRLLARWLSGPDPQPPFNGSSNRPLIYLSGRVLSANHNRNTPNQVRAKWPRHTSLVPRRNQGPERLLSWLSVIKACNSLFSAMTPELDSTRTRREKLDRHDRQTKFLLHTLRIRHPIPSSCRYTPQFSGFWIPDLDNFTIARSCDPVVIHTYPGLEPRLFAISQLDTPSS
jgi:hypothetical protein